MKLSNVTFRWKVLNATLNKIIDGINGNEPIQGEGIRIIESTAGKLISAVHQGSNNAKGTQQQSGTQQGVLVQIQAIDPTTKNIVTLNVYSDGNGFSTSENDWVSVNAVDPATCQQTALTLLKKPT